jgi:hypothetical protein
MYHPGCKEKAFEQFQNVIHFSPDTLPDCKKNMTKERRGCNAL